MSKSADVIVFDLSGPDGRVVVRRTGAAVKLERHEERGNPLVHEGDQLSVQETTLGTLVSHVVLTTRGGFEETFSLLLPRVDLSETSDEAETTAIAITWVNREPVQAIDPGDRPHHVYESVSQLHGTVARTSDA